MNGGLLVGSPFLVRRRVQELEATMRSLGYSVAHVQGAVKGLSLIHI